MFYFLRVYNVLFWFTFVYVCTGSVRRLTNVNFNLKTRTSGLAVTDVDQDGGFEVLVAVLQGGNVVIGYNLENGLFEDIARDRLQFETLRDQRAKTVSVSACDIDGDGVEEIYLHNVNDVYSDVTNDVTHDRLLRKTGNKYADVFDDVRHRELAPRTAGFSVACVDYRGSGKQAFFVTTVTQDGKGVYKMFAVNSSGSVSDTDPGTIVIAEISTETKVRMVKDGRGISVGPIVGMDGSSDIFVTNDNSYYVDSATFRHDGSNVLFKNNGDGTFTDVSFEFGLRDADENGRGSAIGDFTGNQRVDIMYVNWLGPDRLVKFGQRENKTLGRDDSFGVPGPSTILLTCDLDNDGRVEVIKSNTDDDSFYPTTNQLLTLQHDNRTAQVYFKPFPTGENELKQLHITGITAADLNTNGLLELYISHRLFEGRTLSIYEHTNNQNNWIRIMPLTKYGAPARGSKVTLTFTNGDQHDEIIGGGCGYMCQIEPVAHFGLGQLTAREVTLTWPDGNTIRKFLFGRDHRKTIAVSYTGQVKIVKVQSPINSHTSEASRALPHIALVLLSFTIIKCRVIIYRWTINNLF